MRARMKISGANDVASPCTAIVDCPYCDGENVLADRKFSPSGCKLADREIACRHCQCLFLLSESHHGILFRSVKQNTGA